MPIIFKLLNFLIHRVPQVHFIYVLVRLFLPRVPEHISVDYSLLLFFIVNFQVSDLYAETGTAILQTSSVCMFFFFNLF